MLARSLFDDKEKQMIVSAIKEAERNTSGEIRVHIENDCRGETLERAAEVFYRLKMDQTAARNGILFYIAIRHKKFAIIGDAGINSKVGNNFWDDIRDTMIGYFTNNKIADGLSVGILMCGEKLKEFFPYKDDDINELSDEISFDDEE